MTRSSSGICVSCPVDAERQWVTSGCQSDPPALLSAAAAPSRRVHSEEVSSPNECQKGHQRVYNLQKQGTGPAVRCSLICRALSGSLYHRSYSEQKACHFFSRSDLKRKNRSTAELSSWEYVWWGLFLFSFFPPASQSDSQTWPRAGGRAGGVGRAPAARAGRPELWEMEAQAVTQEDAPPEDRRPEDVPVECRDQRIHGSLREELEWVDGERTGFMLCCLDWCKSTLSLMHVYGDDRSDIVCVCVLNRLKRALTWCLCVFKRCTRGQFRGWEMSLQSSDSAHCAASVCVSLCSMFT